MKKVRLSPGDAAFSRKLGQYVDSADVAGVDDGKLSRNGAMMLRARGVARA
jgi:hypothetical protein